MKRFVRPAIIAGLWSLTSMCLLLVVEVTVAYVDGPPREYWGFPLPWLADCYVSSLCLSVHAGFFLMDFLLLFSLWMLAIRFVPALATRRVAQVAAWGGAVVATLYLTLVLPAFGIDIVIFEGFDDWFNTLHVTGYSYGADL